MRSNKSKLEDIRQDTTCYCEDRLDKSVMEIFEFEGPSWPIQIRGGSGKMRNGRTKWLRRRADVSLV